MDKRATIYEVADQAGVSTATVSRVLNDSPNVSDKTKKKVLEVIDELDFSPQLTAQKLATSKPLLLAVVVPSFTTPYYNEVLKGIKDEIGSIDLDMILYNTGSQNREERLERFFNRGMADAFIILSINIEEKIHRQLQATKTPVVLINTTHTAYNYYDINEYRGGQLAGRHLAQQGFDTIGMISSYRDTPHSSERKRGFIDALEQEGITINEDYFVKGESTKHLGFTEESGFEAVQKFEELGSFPEAIFCMSDTQAIGAIYALSKLGMQVPDDIAVMGYDNIKLSKYLDLTTVDQKMHTLGVDATRRLATLLEHYDEPLHKTTIDPILVDRGSTHGKN
jgi:LacI family transcriptional regulator